MKGQNLKGIRDDVGGFRTEGAKDGPCDQRNL
jgi:hypothetical protein